MTGPFYLDHNATTPVDERVLERFVEVEREFPGNPASLHDAGRAARAITEEVRGELARLFDRASEDVIFTSGGTEANNLAVLGLGALDSPVLLSAVEHPSVLVAAQQRGTIEWAIDHQGRARIETTPAQPRPGLVCLSHGQNEVGTLQDVTAAAGVARDAGAPLHIDASQTLGRISLAPLVEHADSFTLSPHKAGGLRGCGVLVLRAVTPNARVFGGGQQRALRPGTESPALVAATGLAVALAVAEHEERAQAMRAAREAFLAQISALDCSVLTPLEDSLPNTVMCKFNAVDGRVLLPALDLQGVRASQGSACSSGSPTPPVVLRAMGLDEDDARRCVRFTFSHRDTIEKVSHAGRIVRDIVARVATS